MSYGANNMPVAQAEFIILSSDDEMLALEEMFEFACPKKDFRYYVGTVIKTMLEVCNFKKTAEEEIAVYTRTNYFVMYMPQEVIDKPWCQYIVHAADGCEYVDRRKDRRSTWLVLKTLVENLRKQLALYQLYDEHGNLMFEYDHVVPAGSLEIRLRRL